MKGLELPINLIIIILIAGIILLALLYLFSSSWQTGGGSIQEENIFRSLCSKFVTQYNCDTNKINIVSITISGKTYKLCDSTSSCTTNSICGERGYTSLNSCAKACGCLL